MLQLVAHSVNFLHIGEDHLRIYSVFLDHATHVLSSQEVRDSSKLLSGSKSKFVVFHSVLGCVNLESSEVESVGEKVVNECSESKTVGPGLCEVTDLDSVIFTGSALAPDQDGLHLGGEGLLAGDSELKSKTSMSSHTSTCAVSVILAKIEKLVIYLDRCIYIGFFVLLNFIINFTYVKNKLGQILFVLTG